MSENRPDRSNLPARYWETKPLSAMSKPEWEALCDSCGKCCLIKLENEDDDSLHFTSVVCRLFDEDSCGCTDYKRRSTLVPGCVTLTPKNIKEIAYWMPSTCAYRLLHEGKPLPQWHPLITGDAQSVATAGHAMAGRVTPEYLVEEDELEDYVLDAEP